VSEKIQIYSCPEFIVLLHTLYSVFQKMSFMGMKKLRTLLKSIPSNKIIGFLQIYKWLFYCCCTLFSLSSCNSWIQNTCIWAILQRNHKTTTDNRFTVHIANLNSSLESSIFQHKTENLIEFRRYNKNCHGVNQLLKLLNYKQFNHIVTLFTFMVNPVTTYLQLFSYSNFKMLKLLTII
jgi:hypothetical protein